MRRVKWAKDRFKLWVVGVDDDVTGVEAEPLPPRAANQSGLSGLLKTSKPPGAAARSSSRIAPGSGSMLAHDTVSSAQASATRSARKKPARMSALGHRAARMRRR